MVVVPVTERKAHSARGRDLGGCYRSDTVATRSDTVEDESGAPQHVIVHDSCIVRQYGVAKGERLLRSGDTSLCFETRLEDGDSVLWMHGGRPLAGAMSNLNHPDRNRVVSFQALVVRGRRGPGRGNGGAER